jgi:hypothetical protein
MLFTGSITGCGSNHQSVLYPEISNTSSPSKDQSALVVTAPRSTGTPLQIPTTTVIPTLSADKAIESFTNSLETANQCNLPCWITITPGKTNFAEVKNVFTQFSPIASVRFFPQKAYMRIFFPNFEAATHDATTEIITDGNGKVAQIMVDASTYRNKNGPINYGNPDFQKLWKRYFLPEIFEQSGLPGNIFLDTTLIAVDTAESYPFVLWIVYPKQGFLIRYEGYNSKDGENITICPLHSKIGIKIWDPAKFSYEQFMKDDRALGVTTSLGPQPIDQVTSFDVQSFYELFRSANEGTCFQTPTAIWPH